MRQLIFTILISTLLCGVAVKAEEPLLKSEYSYRRYTTQDGLPSMIFQTVFKDSKGFLWQGTVNGGSSFDGFNFQPYSLDNSNVHRIDENNGQIRFFSFQEILYPETQKLIHLSDTIKFNTYNSFLLPANYYIFENKERKKYFVKLNNDTISEVMDIPQLQGLTMCKVYLDVQRNLLYIPAQLEKKVYIYNLQNKTAQTIENVIIESFLNHSRLGLLGIGNEGIYKIENDKAVLYIPLKFEMQNKIAKETKNGDIYVKDFYNIYRISDKKVEHLYHSSPLSIWDITLDDDENFWVATNRGLYNFFHFDFKNYQILDHNIRSVTQDNDGIYWFAGDKNDIFTFSNDNFKSITYSDFTYKTLSDVDKAARPLSEELAYVKMYLDLEKIRFLDKFDFQINMDESVDQTVQLPNMILHTYCENAVKHGLMPLKSDGLLTINVSQHDGIMRVAVEDNGVGRAYAAQNALSYSSKQGLSILNRQIEIYNHFNKEKIGQQIDDLFKDGKAAGTIFSVEIPLAYNYIVYS